MSRGTTAVSGKVDHVEKADAAWGKGLPDWVLTLAEQCNMSSQGKVAARLDWSTAAISQVVGNTYHRAGGDIQAVEASVRGVFMNGTITCPALGKLPQNECRDWRKKAKNFGNANVMRVRMYRACNNCIHFTGGGNHG